jgi:serine/threonine-protein kinase RsbW
LSNPRDDGIAYVRDIVESNRYTLEIPSLQDYLPQAEQFLEEKFKQHGLERDDIADLAISATEIINNAIIHGNQKDPDKKVKIEIEFSEDRLTIAITDQGSGFSPDDIPSPIQDDNLLKETGRGIFIVRSLVDDLVIEQAPEGGTRMIIIKKLAS